MPAEKTLQTKPVASSGRSALYWHWPLMARIVCRGKFPPAYRLFMGLCWNTA
jgi:hypothetical protein